MKLLPDKIGASPKQLAALGGLVLLGLVSYFLNRTPSTPEPATPQRPAPVAPAPTIPKLPSVAKRAPNRSAVARGEEFRPTLKVPEGMDVSKIDPTIKLDLLARVRNAEAETGSRGSVFAFGAAPPPPTPKVDPIKVKAMAAAAQQQAQQQLAQPKPQPGPPPAPQAPPIPLKFFGYSTPRHGGPKRAFFLDGEDIDVVNENEVIKNRYKVIRIGVNSVVVEDLNFKSQQTLPLVEELAG